MPCRKITISWLYYCIAIFHVWFINSEANAQVQRQATKDSSQSVQPDSLSDKTLLLKNTLHNTKDSLQSFKDSVRSLFKSTFKSAKSYRGPDSLNRLLNSFEDKDSLSSYLASHLGYDPRSMHKDSLIKKLNALTAVELKKRLAVLKQAIHKPDKDEIAKGLTSFIPVDPNGNSGVAQIGGGYINYNYMFRSAIDTPFVEQNMGQHLIHAQLDVSIVGLPLPILKIDRICN